MTEPSTDDMYLWKYNRADEYGGDFLLLPTEQALLARSDQRVTIVSWTTGTDR